MRNKEFRCHFSIIFSDCLKAIVTFIVVVIGGFLEEFFTSFSDMIDEGEIVPEDLAEISGEEIGIPIELIIAAVALLLGLFFLWRFFVWRRTYIILTDENLIYDKRTLFFKRKIKVDLARIGTVNLKIGIFDRIFGTCTVKLDMSSSVTADETDFRMVFKRDFAKAFENELLLAKNKEQIVYSAENEQISNSMGSCDNSSTFRFNFGYVLRHAVLNTNAFWVILIGAAFTGFAFTVPLIDISPFLYPLIALVGFPLGFILTMVGSILKTILRYYDFTVSRTKNEILISCGLITKHSYRLPISGANAIVVHQSFFARLFGMYYAELLNVGVDDQEDDFTPAVCLMVKEKDIKYMLSVLVPEFDGVVKGTPSPVRAFFPTFVKGILLGFIPVIAIVVLAFYGVGSAAEWFVALSVVAVVVFLFSFASYKSKGIFLSEDILTVSAGILRKRILLVPYSKIQMLDVEKGPISSFLKLRKATVYILSGIFNRANSTGYFEPHIFENIAKKIESHSTIDWRN